MWVVIFQFKDRSRRGLNLLQVGIFGWAMSRGARGGPVRLSGPWGVEWLMGWVSVCVCSLLRSELVQTSNEYLDCFSEDLFSSHHFKIWSEKGKSSVFDLHDTGESPRDPLSQRAAHVRLAFSKQWPSGPMLSIIRNVHMCVCLCVCSLLTAV